VSEEQNHGVEFQVAMHNYQVDVFAVNVEDKFIGFFLSEYSSRGMRCIGVEFHDRVQIEKLRDFLNVQLELMKTEQP
jgi:hypothetical protein